MSEEESKPEKTEGISDEEAMALKKEMTTSEPEESSPATPDAVAPEQEQEESTVTLAIRFAIVLVVITSISGLFLAGVYAVTKTGIEKQEKRGVQEGIQIAYSGSVEDFPADHKIDEIPGDKKPVDKWTVSDASGNIVCRLAKGTEKGYASDVSVIVGVQKVDGDWKIRGIKILATGETPGLGENVHATPPTNSWVGYATGKKSKDPQRPKFQTQFKGLPLSVLLKLDVKKICKGPEYKIDAMSGATITSYAVINAMKKAATKIQEQIDK